MSVSTWPQLFNKNNFILNSLVFSGIKQKKHENSSKFSTLILFLLFLQKNLIAELSQFQIYINFHCKIAKF